MESPTGLTDSELFFRFLVLGIMIMTIVGIVLGLSYLVQYLDSINMINDSIRDNLGAIILGAFSQ